MGKFRRFMLPVALSIAVHAGIYSGASDMVAERQGSRITQKVMEEGPAGKRGEKKKPDLEALKAERERYVQELFSALKEGKEIRLSEFFIKSEALDERIRLAELGEFWAGEEEIRAKYAKIVGGARKFAAGSENEVQSVYEFLREGRIMTTYYFANGMFSDVVETGWFNCTSSTMLLSALIEDVLGRRDHQVLVFDDHLKTYLDGRMIENTGGEWSEKEYDGCGLVAPLDIFVAAYLHANGVQPEEFPEKISKLYTEEREWKNCSKKRKNIFDARSGLSFPTAGVASGGYVPPYPLPLPGYKQTSEQIVQNARGIYTAWQIVHMWDDSRFVEVELNGKKLEMNPIVIPAGINWPEVLEGNVGDSGFEPFLSEVPRWARHCSPRNEIPPATIPEIIEGLIKRGNRKFEEHTKEAICQRFEKVLDRGRDDEIAKYIYYNFCPELNEKLREAYLRKRNNSLLWFGIGNLRNPENFDFLAGELESGGDKADSNAGIALVLSDKERACRLFSTLGKEKLEQLKFERIWGCDDNEAMWGEIKDNYEGKTKDTVLPAALEDLDVSTVNPERRQLLLGVAGKVDFQQKLQIARILYEAGDKESSMRIAKGSIEEAKRETKEAHFICNFPEEFLPEMVPLMQDPRYADGIAYEVMRHGKQGEYVSILKKTLREVLNNPEGENYRRGRAALALLVLGVDPLGND